jgi:hydrogenase nickel incorporation protein HypB
MCTTCGCGSGEHATVTALPGPASEEHGQGHAHEHEHVHADGTVHRHAHDHPHDHAHDHGEHVHEHEHVHADGTVHRHAHNPTHDHGHERAHDHGHEHAGAHVHEHEHAHADGAVHRHAHGHAHAPDSAADPVPEAARTVALEQAILAKNQRLAERNRGWLAGREILALNLMSSPGSGKTTLLERTLRDLRGQRTIAVVEGDQASFNDAERIRATGAPVVQINTGAGCHLEADQFARALWQLKPAAGSIVLIENVGNLVCPALFDLGEHAKVVILSVTEGEDKPVKYPHMFRACTLMLLSKTDLLPHVDFDVERCVAYARQVNPRIEVLQVSARSGAGLAAWYGWLERQHAARALADAAS